MSAEQHDDFLEAIILFSKI